MNFVELSAIARKQIKELRKKYHSIPEDLLDLINDIITNPEKADDLGGNL